MKKIYLYIIFLTPLLYSQNFKIGFDLEGNWVKLKGGLLGGEGAPISYHILAEYSPLNNFSLQAKFGSTLMVNFTGLELGISGKYLFYYPFYFSAGILEHSNSGGRGSNTWGTDYVSVWMLHGGVGINAAKFMSFELSYYIPTSEKSIGYRWNYDHSISYSHVVKGMVRLGLVFGLDI